MSVRKGDFPRPTAGCGYYVRWGTSVTFGGGWINAYGGGYSVEGRTLKLGLGESRRGFGAADFFNIYFDTFIAYGLNSKNGGGVTLAGKGGLLGVRKDAASEEDPGSFFALWAPTGSGISVGGLDFFSPERPHGCPELDFSGVGGGNCENGIDSIRFCLSGDASPPPPPPKNMCGCDCNTIASIIAEQMVEKQRLLDAIKDHVDMRTIEQLRHTNTMLQGIDIDLDIQPVIDELKRIEKNLWNGINGG